MKCTKHQYPTRHQDLAKPGMVLSIQIFLLGGNLPSEFSLCINKGNDNIIHSRIVSTQIFFRQFDLYSTI